MCPGRDPCFLQLSLSLLAISHADGVCLVNYYFSTRSEKIAQIITSKINLIILKKI